MTLYCLSAKDGKLIWKVNALKEHDGINPRWGKRPSPLIFDDLVIIYGGGPKQSFLAFDKNCGKVNGKQDLSFVTHATPIITKIHGVEQAISFASQVSFLFFQKAVRNSWRQEFPYKVSTAASPVVAGDLVYCLGWIWCWCRTFTRLANEEQIFPANRFWRKPNDVINHWSTSVYHDGHLYGMFSFKIR